jgi:RimJ/RimL family protein N-acetyltransferase
MTVLETERLRLRHFTDDDAEFLVRLLNEPSFLQNIGDRGVRTLDDARTYLENGPVKMYREHGHGLFAVELRDTGERVGMCGLLRRDQFEDVDVGYAFLPEFWGKGYARESASAVLAWGARELGLTRAIALVKPGNTGSVRVLETLGFTFREHVRMNPDAPETAIYELAEID